MIKTEFKKLQSFENELKNKKNIAILSCGTCANVCKTGGNHGIAIIRDCLWNKNIIFEKTIAVMCFENLVEYEIKNKLNNIDAIVLLSCSAGYATLVRHTNKQIVMPLITLGNYRYKNKNKILNFFLAKFSWMYKIVIQSL